MRRQGRFFSLWLVCIASVVGAAGVPLYAASYDLTSGGVATINGAIFTPYDVGSATGTGRFDPFLRVHGNGIESGYNTDGEVEFQTMPSPWTHSLLVSDVPPVEVGGELYREFLLDIAQQGGSPNLSLDELVISLETAPDLTGHPGPDNYQNFSDSVIYSLDSMSVDNSIIINASFFKGPGNGGSDLRVLIPEEYFDGNPNQCLYLYSVFGEEVEANDGFEEWGTVAGDGTPQVPAPAAVLLASMGIGLVGWLQEICEKGLLVSRRQPFLFGRF